MTKNSGTQVLTQANAGQYVSLSVAAHLARTQLLPDSLNAEDARQASERLNFMALALVRTATLYAAVPGGSEPRALTAPELEGARSQHSASQLVLKDGRVLAGVTIRRADLQQAIAILRAVGLGDTVPAREVTATVRRERAELLARAAEIEGLLDRPEEAERAKKAALWIARNSDQGRVANLAMQLMSALHHENGSGSGRDVLARLRQALGEEAV